MKNGPYELVIAPADFPGKRYRNRYCYEHTLVYWQTHGILPGPGEVVHHKDENKRNNAPDNLELKTVVGHSTEHSLERGRKYADLKCPHCGSLFTRIHNATHLGKGKGRASFCRRECTGAFGTYANATPDQEAAISANVVSVYRLLPDGTRIACV